MFIVPILRVRLRGFKTRAKNIIILDDAKGNVM
jgi:hypothetical protein